MRFDTSISGNTFDLVRYWYANGRPSRMEIANTSGDLSQVNSYTPYYLQYNWHGDAVTVVDPDGAGGNQGNAYDPWGNGATPQASGRNYYGWNGGFGYQYFSALGMYYVHGRWYDPNVGRFISPDEKGEYLYGSGEDAVNWVWSAGQDAYCQFVSDETLGLPAALDQLLQYITNGERVSGYTTMCIENQGGDAFNFGAAFGRGTSYALSVVEIVGGIDMIVGGGVGGAVTCPVTFGGGCAARAGAVAVGAAGVVHGGAVIVRNLQSPIMRAQSTGSEGESRISPSQSPIWRNLQPYRGGIKRSGQGRNTRYYTWDYLHGEIEVFDRNGDHLGAIDPIGGNPIKGRVPGRNIRSELK